MRTVLHRAGVDDNDAVRGFDKISIRSVTGHLAGIVRDYPGNTVRDGKHQGAEVPVR